MFGLPYCLYRLPGAACVEPRHSCFRCKWWTSPLKSCGGSGKWLPLSAPIGGGQGSNRHFSGEHEKVIRTYYGEMMENYDSPIFTTEFGVYHGVLRFSDPESGSYFQSENTHGQREDPSSLRKSFSRRRPGIERPTHVIHVIVRGLYSTSCKLSNGKKCQGKMLNFRWVSCCSAARRLGDRPGRRETSALMPKPSLLSQNPRSASIA